MKKRKHRILDNKPVLGYFLLFLFSMICMSIASNMIDGPIAGILPGYGAKSTKMGTTIVSAAGIGSAIGVLIVALIFKLWFRPDYKGMISLKGLKTGLIMMIPFLIFHYIGSIVSWTAFGTGSVLIAFLRAFAPGFGEEISFRGLGVANYMRTVNSEKQISFIFWLSSVFFGLIHIFNALAGGDLFSCVLQALYAVGVGMLFCAVYLRTGNIMPTILAHMSVDFMEFIRADLSETGGIMTGMGVGDWITIAAGLFAGIWAMRLMKKDHYPEIMALWKEKWSQDVSVQNPLDSEQIRQNIIP